MRSKPLLFIVGVAAIVVIVALVLRSRDDRSSYTEAQRAEVRSLAEKVDSGYARADAANLPVFETYLALLERKGNRDSLIKASEAAIVARGPVIAQLRHELDSLEVLKRDTASTFTKGLELYLKATRHALMEMESQGPAMTALQGPGVLDMPVPPVPPPTAMPAGGPEVDPATPPIAMPLASSLSILKRLNQERAKARTMMASE